MKAIVTGGAGFIGSHLVDSLIEWGHDVTVIDNCSTGRQENLSHVLDQINFIEEDLAVEGLWANCFEDADWVFHLASLADIVPSIQMPEAYFRANVVGTFNVLKASQMGEVSRLVYVASSSGYGIPDVYPTAEDAPIKPEYPYALTKRLGEEMVLHWEQVFGIPSISLRFFNVYGPRSRTSGTYGAVFGVFLAQKLAGLPFTVVGDGEQTRDFTYVTDVVNALITAAASDRSGEIYNVGSGRTVSINRLVELLGGERIHIPKRPGEPDCTFADVEKIRSQLGWEAKVAIEEGVDKVLGCIDYWSEAPVWTPSSIADATSEWFTLLGEGSSRQ